MKKPLIIAVVIALLLIAGLVFWNTRDNSRSSAIVVYGNVDIRQVSLAFDASGRVMELHAEEGDAITAGDLLAVLDTRTLALQAEQASAQIEVQNQNLLRLRNGSRPEEIEQARDRLAAAEADAKRANQDLVRAKGLPSGKAISLLDLDRLRSVAQVADAKRDELRDALRLEELGAREEDIAGAEAQLKASQASLALLQHQIELGQLIAPANGVVRSRLLEPGDMANPQRPVFALALTDPKWIRTYVNEVDLGKIQPGMAARVTTDSHPDTVINGKVGYISSVAEFTPKSVQTVELRTSLVYEVRVLVEDPNNQLRLGQPATVTFALASAK